MVMYGILKYLLGQHKAFPRYYCQVIFNLVTNKHSYKQTQLQINTVTNTVTNKQVTNKHIYKHQLSLFLGQFLSQIYQEIPPFLQILSRVKFFSVFPCKWRYSILDWKKRVSSDPFPNQLSTIKLHSLIIHHKYFT